MRTVSTRASGNTGPSSSRVTIDDSHPGELLVAFDEQFGDAVLVPTVFFAIVPLAFAAALFFMFAQMVDDWLAAALAGSFLMFVFFCESLTVWREEYRLDIATSRITIVRQSRLRRKQSTVTLSNANEVRVKCSLGDEEYRVLIIAAGRRVQLGLPTKITLTDARDGRRVGLAFAAALSVPMK